MLAFGVAGRAIEIDAGKRSHQLDPPEMRLADGFFAREQDCAAETAAGVARMDEESADACWFSAWVEQRVVSLACSVAAEKRLAFAPAATGNDRALLFGHEIGLIADQLPIDAEDR